MSISDSPPRQKRRKRTPEEAREEALAAARLLLLEGGPNAVTLAAVGRAIGMTHANVIHHFGSAAALQSDLMASMVRDLRDALEEAVVHARSDDAAPRRLVDIVFDAFGAGGAGSLAAWIALSGDLQHLETVRQAVVDLVAAIEEKLQQQGDPAHSHVASAVLLIGLSAFGDALVGPSLRDMLGKDEESTRRIIARLLPGFFT
jgi:AcrR family transcriptional regulator